MTYLVVSDPEEGFDPGIEWALVVRSNGQASFQEIKRMREAYRAELCNVPLEKEMGRWS